MSDRGDRAAFAANWRTVLAVDAALGVVAFVAGLVLVVTGTVALGAPLAAAGLVYLVLNVRRRRRWRRLRADAGL